MGWVVEAGLHEDGVPPIEDACCMAAGSGDMAMLACLRRLNISFEHDQLDGATEVGYVPLPMIRWMVENGASWNRRAVQYAVQEAKELGKYVDSVVWPEARLALDPGREGS